MTIAGIAAFIVSIAKAIPIVDSWLQKLIALIIQARYNAFIAENKKIIETAIQTHNQIPIEQQMGSDLAGKPTGYPGTQIVDTLPGVDK